jgi:SNF2 family DNA or RNA helicase
VVCPKSALLVWKKELTDFKDLQQNNHAILVVDGQSSQKTDVIRNSNSNYKFFLVIGVEQFASYILDNSKQGKALMQTGFDLLIIDEAHALRKKTLQASKAVSEMKRADPTLKLLLLTGTPMQNNFTELFELINIMRPTAELETTAAPFGMYPNMAKEKKEFLKIAREAGPAMKSKIEEYFLRRYKYQVLDLPDKCDMTVWLTLTPAIRSIHERVEVLYSQKLKEVNASINESNLKTHQNASDDAEHLDGDEELEDTDTRSNPVFAIYGSLISLVNDVSCMKQRV